MALVCIPSALVYKEYVSLKDEPERQLNTDSAEALTQKKEEEEEEAIFYIRLHCAMVHG